MRPEDCPFRQEVETIDEQESARCLLAADLVGVPRRHAVRVARAACELCLEQNFVELVARHPVLPSLLLQQTSLAQSFPPDTDASLSSDERTPRRRRWEQVVEAAFAPETTVPRGGGYHPSFDVILRIDSEVPGLTDSIESILHQQDVNVWLHLLDARGEPPCKPPNADPVATATVDRLLAALQSRWNVKIHRIDPALPTLEAIVRIARQLTSPYVALQTPCGVSDLRRLVRASKRLDHDGAEIVLAAWKCAGIAKPAFDDSTPARGSSRSHAQPTDGNLGAETTLVVRRATLIDMALDHPAALVSADAFVRQAADDEREIFLEDRIQVRVHDPGELQRIHDRQRQIVDRRRPSD